VWRKVTVAFFMDGPADESAGHFPGGIRYGILGPCWGDSEAGTVLVNFKILIRGSDKARADY
jgi:hypothetical protein